MAKINVAAEKKAYKAYRAAGLTPAGACALIGNQEAESDGFYPKRLEYLCRQRLREAGKDYTDETYTAAVDSGEISRAEYLNPLPGKQYGHGLCQWTSPSRKAGLYDLAKKRGVSIGDLELQIEYTLWELAENYPAVLEVLRTAQSIRTASDVVLKRFESPADTSEPVCASRAARGQKFWDDCGKALEGVQEDGVTAEDVLNVIRGWIGMSRAVGTHKPIIDIYNTIRPLPRGYKVTYQDDYCDATVSAAFQKLGAVDLIAGGECGVEEHAVRARSAGILQEDGSIIPEPGYVILYNWDDGTQPNNGWADHIGIVEKVDKQRGIIVAIEGNMNGGVVGRREIPIGWGYIRGYIIPAYAQGAVDKPTEEPQEPDGSLNYTPRWVGRVTADLLNVRSWAGTEYGNIKSWPQLAHGNLVDVCDTVKDAYGEPWYFIRIAGNIYGFACAAYFERA